MLFILTSCGEDNIHVSIPAPTAEPAPTPEPAPTAAPTPITTPEPATDGSNKLPGKIAFITNTVDCNEEEYRRAEQLQAKYGEENVIHRTWPATFAIEGEQMISIVQQIAADPEVKALIINMAVIGTNAAVDKLLETRNDIFIAYAYPAENPPDVSARAHLVLNTNDPLRGETIVMQAKAMGAETFAHYSFPRHMAVPSYAMRRDVMKAACEREGLRFEDLTAPDPTSEVGIPGAQQFIMEDVPKQVEALGKNTAFFSTNCAMQIPLITKVISEGAIYPEPCCPSPYHAFPQALGVEDRGFFGTNINEEGEDTGRMLYVSEVVPEIKKAIAAQGATGRLATWPMPVSMMNTNAAFYYAIEWMNGNVPQEKGNIDYDVLAQVCADYSMEEVGEPIGVELNPLSLTGRVYPNYVMLIIKSLVF